MQNCGGKAGVRVDDKDERRPILLLRLKQGEQLQLHTPATSHHILIREKPDGDVESRSRRLRLYISFRTKFDGVSVTREGSLSNVPV